MNSNFFILVVAMLPTIANGQNLGKCEDVVVMPKELYDNFQNLSGNLERSDGEVGRDRRALNEIKEKYRGCENLTDVAAMIKERSENLQRVEGNRKTWADAFASVDAKVRQLIKEAHERPVVYRFFDPNPTDKLGTIVTMTFVIQKDKVVVLRSDYLLPDPGAQ